MMWTSPEGSVNALCPNKDGSHVVVAGRNVLKILRIDNSCFQEEHNFRAGKNVNLNFSCLDVAWSHVEGNLLASASTNGAVVIWDLNKSAKNKLSTVLAEHKRTVNSVTFHHSEPSIVLSCSQDGTIRLFDLRAVPNSVVSLDSGVEAVRDVKFSPFHSHRFASADESGNLKIWDYRSNDKVLKQFTAHNGPLLGIDFHLTKKDFIASAGRDKQIKIWDLFEGHCEQAIQTIAPVKTVRWRPTEDNQLASCSLVMDSSIYVWDLLRPFVPLAVFDVHKDVATGIAWRPNANGNLFFSCSKDQTIFQHQFSDGTHTDESTRRIGLTFSADGDIALTISDDLLSKNAPYSVGEGTVPNPVSSSRRNSTYSWENVTSVPQKSQYSSSLFVFRSMADTAFEEFSMKWFVETAKQSRLTGTCYGELCDKNAETATALGRFQLKVEFKQIQFRLLKHGTFYDCFIPVAPLAAQQRVSMHQALWRTSKVMKFPTAIIGELCTDRMNSAVNAILASDGEAILASSVVRVGGAYGELDHEQHEDELDDRGPVAVGSIHPQGDFYFGDGELSAANYDDYDVLLTDTDNPSDWVLPTEAFQPRTDMIANNSSPASWGPMLDQYDASETSSIADNESSAMEKTPGAGPLSDGQRRDSGAARAKRLLNFPLGNEFRIPPLNCTTIVRDILYFYAQQGDVQIAVSIILVLKDKVRNVVDEKDQEKWFNAYIELLQQFELYIVAATVIKLCHLPSIQQLSQQSTAVFVCCNRCQKPTEKGFYCTRCKSLTSGCSICHYPIRGIFVWCQVCSHGGHLNHLKDWFSKYKYCPSGCGHECEAI